MFTQAAPLFSGCSGQTPKGAVGHPRSEAYEARVPDQHEQTASSLRPPRHFASLIERARAASKEPAKPASEAPLPETLKNIDWYGYRGIAFRPEKGLWHQQQLPFEAQFFHLGFIYRLPVAMYEVHDQKVAPIRFSPEYFTYEGVPAPAADANLDYAGMRLHTYLNSNEHMDEVMVLQGGSYFRVVGRGNWHGLSGRALSVDMGQPTPEEFPRFTELYLVRPQKGDTSAWVLGMIDSPRVAAAVAFHVEPGDTTVVDVSIHVFPREPLEVLGLATFSSMHLFGEADAHRFGDVRPEVHDSDGLAMWTTQGERVYRPLRNPDKTTVSHYRLDSPRGFGLLQRDRRFESYQDLTERYEARPSAWVEPIGDWGKGQLRLLEWATPLESDDNMALAWLPDDVPAEGLALRYRLHFGMEVDGSRAFGRVENTRMAKLSPERARYYVDFSVPNAQQVTAPVQVDVSGADLQVISKNVERNPHVSGFRATFEVARKDPSKEVPLRAFLRTESGDVLTETWSYPWQPKL